MKNKLISVVRNRFSEHPVGFFVLFYTEMWELFGRFGITSLLVLYLTKMFSFADTKAFNVYSTFAAMFFITPIFGGILSDRFLGYKRAILFGAIIMVIGNSLLVIPQPETVYLGLAVVAVGFGFFSPSMAPLVGLLYERDETGRDAGFTLYYLAKNIGALLAPILCGVVAVHYGYNYAFLLSAVGMLSGIIVFTIGQKKLIPYYKRHPSPRNSDKSGFFSRNYRIYLLALLVIPLVRLVFIYNLTGYLLAIVGVFVVALVINLALRRPKDQRNNIFMILIGMIFVIVFETFLGQGGTTLSLFIDRVVDRRVFGMTIPPSAFYSLDPIFMLLIGPFLASLWTSLARRKCEFAVTSKFILALFLLALGFSVFVVGSYQAIATGRSSSLYVVVAYFLFPMAELCIIPIGLSMVTRLAPKDLQAMMVGVWMLANSASGYLTGVISKYGEVDFAKGTLQNLQQAAVIYKHMFSVSAITLFIAAVVLILASPGLKRLVKLPMGSFIQKQDDLTPLV